MGLEKSSRGRSEAELGRSRSPCAVLGTMEFRQRSFLFAQAALALHSSNIPWTLCSFSNAFVPIENIDAVTLPLNTSRAVTGGPLCEHIPFYVRYPLVTMLSTAAVFA